MEVPSKVLIHNDLLGIKGNPGTLIRIAEEGFYEVNMAFGGRIHRVLLPIQGTVLINPEPESANTAGDEIER